MVEKLDYATPPHKPPASPLRKSLSISGIIHLFVVMFYAPALDGGQLARACFIISVAYWLVVGLILLRRRTTLTRVDLWFIALGYPAMLLAGLAFGAEGSRHFDWQRFGSW